MKKRILLLKLFLLTVLGKNHSKADAVRKSNLFKTYGGGTGIPAGCPLTLS